MSRFPRIITDALPICPAGAGIAETPGGSACLCRVEDHVIESTKEQSTMALHCYSEQGYMGCPTWRADKESYWAEHTNRGLLRDGDLRVPDAADREHQRQRAIAALAEDS